MQNAVYNIKKSGNLGSKLNNTIPSTIPHGYFLPLIFLPPTSKTVLLPTTANGIPYKKKKKMENNLSTHLITQREYVENRVS